MAELPTQRGLNKLDPKSFGSIIDDIEYQKSFLFSISLPDIKLKGPVTRQLTPRDAFQLCTSSTAFPVMTSEVQTVAFYNSQLKLAAKTTYSNWSVVFKMDLNKQAASAGSKLVAVPSIPIPFGAAVNIPDVEVQMDAVSSYEYFYTWQSAVFDFETRVSYLPHEYKKDIDLFLLNEMAQPVSGFKLEGAFPVSVSGGNLSYSDDNILTFTVDFAFDRFLFNGTVTR